MALYFSYTLNINDRKADSLFLFNNSQCFYFSHKGQPLMLFEAPSYHIGCYHKINQFAQEKGLDNYEIIYNEEIPLEDLLDYLSSYLNDVDLSIGVVTRSPNINEQAQPLLESYGVTISHHILRKTKSVCCKPMIEIPTGSMERAIKPKLYPKKPSPIQLDESFHDKFMKLVIESGKDNAEIYKKACVSRQVFSSIISNKDLIPKKLTLISLCIGLELPLRTAQELMMSAGYSLSKSIMVDSIVMKYLKEEIYNFDLINSELDEFGCPLLGWHPRED